MLPNNQKHRRRLQRCPNGAAAFAGRPSGVPPKAAPVFGAAAEGGACVSDYSLS